MSESIITVAAEALEATDPDYWSVRSVQDTQDAVRAVLKAIREPTDDMLQIGVDARSEAEDTDIGVNGDGERDVALEIRHAWVAMVDAALAEDAG